MTAPERIPVLIADRDFDEAAWLAGRAEGVTATDVGRLAAGGIQTRRSILSDKQNGASFRGNADTERGHRREPIIAEWITRRFGILPNSFLWASAENSLYRCTPDGLGQTLDGDDAGFEIKSTIEDWETEGIPDDHIDQCLWCMEVTGRDRWLFVWEQLDENGQPPLEPSFRWIERDDERIAELRAAADKFLTWRDAGAPTVDADMTEELDEAISRHVAARAVKNRAEAAEKAAEKTIRDIIAADPVASAHGWDRSGNDGGLLYKVTHKVAFDEEMFASLYPKQSAELKIHRAAIEKLLATEAAADCTVPTAPSTRLVIAAHKPEKKAAA